MRGRRADIPFEKGRVRLTLPVLMVLIGGISSVFWAIHREDQYRRSTLQEQAILLARTVDAEKLDRFISSGMKRESAEFQQIHQHLRRILFRIPDGTYIYLMAQGKTEQDVMFLMDVERDPEPEDPVFPGAPYEEASDELMESLQTGQAFVEGPLPDEWGGWVSGFAPVWHPRESKPIALLGLDIDAADWRGGVLRAGLIPALMTLITLWYVLRIKHVFYLSIQKESEGQNREAIYTVGFGLLLNLAFVYAIHHYEHEIMETQLRESGILKANAMTALFRDVEIHSDVVHIMSYLRHGDIQPERFSDEVKPLMNVPGIHRVLWSQRVDDETDVLMASSGAGEDLAEGVHDAVTRAIQTESSSVGVEAGRWLWLVRPVPDQTGQALILEFDLERFFAMQMRDHGLEGVLGQTALRSFWLESEVRQVPMNHVETRETPDVLLTRVPWYGFGSSFLIEVWPRKGGAGWVAINTMTYATAVAGFIVSLMAGMLVRQYVVRQREVERLLRFRDKLLDAAAKVNQQLLTTEQAEKAMSKGLAILGEASGQDRVYYFSYHKPSGAQQGLVTQEYEWVREGISSELNNPDTKDLPFEETLPRWASVFAQGDCIEGLVESFPPDEREILERQGILSMLVMPVFSHGQLRGFIGFDNCTERYEWSAGERAALRSVASSLGAWLIRRDAETQLRFRNLELKSAVQQARLMMEEAEQANAAKGEFLARMSHEIRTPMNGVLGMARLMEMEDLSEEQEKRLHVIINSGELLLQLINDILDFSKIDAGKVEFSLQPFDLRAVIEGTQDLLQVKADEKEIGYQSSIDPDVPKQLIGDPLRIGQVLMNVVGNAIKYTEEGEVEVRAHVEEKTEQSATVKIEVVDSGIGIPEERIEGLFDEFTQVDSSTSRRYEGTGLGLAIVRKLLEQMGGSIDVKSHLGSGSTFVVILRLDIPESTPVPQKESAPTQGPVSLPDRSSLSILIAEDNLVNQKVIQQYLRKLGMESEIVPNGRAALEQMQTAAYQLVLMDLHMPEMDGLEATRSYREWEKGESPESPLTIVALTADAIEGDREKCLEAGMNDYLTKPLKLKELTEMLNRWFPLTDDEA